MNMQQRQVFGQEMSKELEKVTMSWSNDLKEWYPHAMQALRHASPASLQVNAKQYPQLFLTDLHGIKMNTVAVLANNLEARTPIEMGLSNEDYLKVIELNAKIGEYWEALAEPIRNVVGKRIELMSNTGNLKPIIAQA